MKKLSDLLPDSLPSNFQSYLKVKKVWNDSAGEQIAFITTPGSLKDGTLNIAVHDQTWVSEIGFLKGELVQRLKSAGLQVDNINFYFKQRQMSESEKSAPVKKAMTDKEKEFADRLIMTINDEALRTSFKRAIYAYFTVYTLDDYLNC